MTTCRKKSRHNTNKMFENPVVGEIDSLCRELIRKGFIDKAIELQFKLSEMRDLSNREHPINHELYRAYIKGNDESLKELFEQREKLMREFYIGEIQPHFKSYLTRRE